MIKKYMLKRLILAISLLLVLKNNNVILNEIKLNKFFIFNKAPFIKTIYFNYDLYYFSNKINNILKQYVIYIRNNPSKQLLLKINTNVLGNIKYNFILNKSRMSFIVNNLVLNGIHKNNIKYIICVKNKKVSNELNTLNNNKLIVNIL
ncbi:peptidoglycan-binding protein [Candidatus Portiera aleyrodidarum]|uniref:Peptidoglycan-binding protein n=2 Tax=Candidatus Portiera aleyrodidarum TaxID=91844 RepID=A0AAU8RPH9_9GAMM|nr:peptidoglycan-binding protein [Candidatus Portiera aleyrodidarum]AFS18932.1 Peptidoglycan-associated lipoprotein [Candidatus Portiera aleyrodidarum BT-QVLC]AFT80583.1 hypothetical protein C548_219 [Candidatus Portiera aleyrodidarum BT-QVLC]AJF24154.1 peptidoglycan-binding protein [Candidatus Portiera aleyrodidarum MED (Bemisia tabaci)]